MRVFYYLDPNLGGGLRGFPGIPGILEILEILEILGRGSGRNPDFKNCARYKNLSLPDPAGKYTLCLPENAIHIPLIFPRFRGSSTPLYSTYFGVYTYPVILQ